MQSYPDYKLGIGTAGIYKIALDSDDKKFDGHGRLDHDSEHLTVAEDWDGRQNSIMVYVPSRVGLVFYKCD